jgi:hypothetical protein
MPLQLALPVLKEFFEGFDRRDEQQANLQREALPIIRLTWPAALYNNESCPAR